MFLLKMRHRLRLKAPELLETPDHGTGSTVVPDIRTEGICKTIQRIV